MRNFRTYQLAKNLHNLVREIKWPETIIKDQVYRASLSIVLNISEGYGKQTPRDRRRFYQIAMGSLRETQACLDLYANAEAEKIADQLGAYLYRLIQNPGRFP